MKKITKKVVSLFLALMIVLGSIPLSNKIADILFDSDVLPFIANAQENVITTLNINYPTDVEIYADSFNYSEYLCSKYKSQESFSVISEYLDVENKSICYIDVKDIVSNPLYWGGSVAWNLLTFDFSSAATGQDFWDEKSSYESIIFNFLETTMNSDNLVDWLEQSYVKNSIKISKSITDCFKLYSLNNYTAIKSASIGSDFIAVDNVIVPTGEFDAYVTSKLENSVPGIIGSDISFVSDALEICGDINSLIDTLSQYLQIADLNYAIVDVLKSIGQNADNTALKIAINEVVAVCDDAFNTILIGIANGTYSLASFAVGKYAKQAWKQILTSLTGSEIIANGVLIGQTIGKAVCNICFSTDKELEQVLKMRNLITVEKSLAAAMPSLLQSDDYSIVISAVEMLFSIYRLDATYIKDFYKFRNGQVLGGISDEDYQLVVDYIDGLISGYEADFSKVYPIGGEKCGENLFWVVDNSRLIIWGLGDMDDYGQSNLPPWSAYAKQVSEISVSSFTTSIGKNAFFDFDSLSSDLIFKNVQKLYEHSLPPANNNYCTVFYESVSILGSNSIGKSVFFKSLNFEGEEISICSDTIVGENFKLGGSLQSNFVLQRGSRLIVGGDANFVTTGVFLEVVNSYVKIEEGSSVIVEGDMKIGGGQAGGNWSFHWMHFTLDGRAEVSGDVTIGTSGYVHSKFYMQNESSYLHCGGNFTWTSENQFYVDNGIIEVCGDCEGDFKLTGQNTISFLGITNQNINGNCTFNNFICTVLESVTINSDSVTVNGKLQTGACRVINGEKLILSGGSFVGGTYLGNIKIAGKVDITEDLLIDGDFLCNTNIATNLNICNGADLTVKGNATFVPVGVFLEVVNSYVTIHNGASIMVEGDMKIGGGQAGGNWSFHWMHFTLDGRAEVSGDVTIGTSGYVHSKFYMQKESSYLYIGGNLNRTSENQFYVNNGTMELNGNCTGNLNCTNDNNLVFSGTDTQYVSGSNTFSYVVLENRSDEGVVFENKVTVSTLFNHKSNVFTLYNNASGSSISDYDGDNIKDHLDPYPTVGNPCIITVVSENIEKGSAVGSISTIGGNVVSVVATPTFKYEFTKWIDGSGKTISNLANYTFVAKKDVTLTAIFAKRQRNITVACENGSVSVPKKAEIESVVTISAITPAEGYVFIDGSLLVNGIEIVDNSFYMPDEDVVVTAEFLRNDNYFDLKEKILQAKQYDGTYYTIDSYQVLINTIEQAESMLKNDVSKGDAQEQILLIENAENSLVERSPIELVAVVDNVVPIGCDISASNLTITLWYDNKTSEIITGYEVSGFDSSIVETQTVTITHQNLVATVEITVVPEAINSISVYALPTKTEYFIGDEFVSDGLIISLNYNTGRTEQIDSGFACTPLSFSEAGNQEITVTYEGKTASFFVIVNTPVSSVEILTTTYRMVVGDTFVFSVRIEPQNATYPQLTWSVSDSSVLTITPNGEITAQGVGTATVTATSHNGLISTCFVEVVDFNDDSLSDDFVFEFIDNGASVKVVGYIGEESVVSIPETVLGIPVTSVSSNVCLANENVSKLILSSNINDFDYISLAGCSSLLSMSVVEENEYFAFADGVLFNADYTELYFCLSSVTETYCMPETVSVIGNNAFSGILDLEEIYISESTKIINSNAFANANITKIYYQGTSASWESIEISDDSGLDGRDIFFCKHTVSFYKDGEEVSTKVYQVGDSILVPELELDDGYYLEGWTPEVPDVVPDMDLLFYAVIKPVVYTATFTYNGEVVGTDEFTVEDVSLNYPVIEQKAYYNWVWDEHGIIADNITVNGEYVPINYTIKFVSNGKTRKTQNFNVETADTIIPPSFSLPSKVGYYSDWEEWEGKICNLTVNEIYVPIVYSARFWCNGNLVRTSKFTVENKKTDFTMPYLPKQEGYKVVWQDFEIVPNDIDVYGEYVPIEYTATFVADGVVVSTQTFTVETESLDVPLVPQKAGYYARWSSYELKAKDITIVAKYHLPEVVTVSKRTLDVGDTYRLLPSCNFEITKKAWVSSNMSVATVNQHGKVTAVGKGECEITTTCYGKDSLGNDIKASKTTKIIVNDNSEGNTSKRSFRDLFDEFFEVTLHEVMYNFREFMLVLFRYTY